MNLFDYIYVDLEKCVSLYSQLTGGVVEVRESRIETGGTSDNKRSYDFKVFQHHAGGTEHDLEQAAATIKPHHSLLQELEVQLVESGHLLDLASGATLRSPEFRGRIGETLCIKCRGRCVIEDYERIKKVAKDFPEIVKLINKSNESAVIDTPEYKAIAQKLEELESAAGDRNQKARRKQQAKELRKQLDGLVKGASSVEAVPQWILDGMGTWIDAFIPGITNIRVFPYQDKEDEQVFGHLERDNFMVSNSTAFHFTYGSFPTEELTMVGLVTSVPVAEPVEFDPLGEFKKDELKDYEAVERAFRGVFRGFDGFESMVRTIRYPRVLVHPILVYRESSPSTNGAA
jgi:hypothetical protein